MPRLFLLLALLLPVTVQALTVRPPSFSELVGTADLIVVGEVTSLETVLRKTDDRTVPFTLVTIAIAETLKGPPEATVVLRCLGGTVGSASLRVVGVPEFAVGDRGFFFVQGNGTQFFPLVGVTHGLYRSVRDPGTGAEFIMRANGEPLRSVAEVSAPLEHSARPLLSGAPPSGGALSSIDFARQIKAEVAREIR